VDAHAEVLQRLRTRQENTARCGRSESDPRTLRGDCDYLSALESRNAVSRAAASPTYLGESSSPWNALACRMDVSNAINISDDVHFPFRSPHAPSSSEEARRSAFSAD
jgi:hypothetical protein